MKKSWDGGVISRVGGIVALTLLATGMLLGQNALAGIANTKHNLGANTITDANLFTPTSGTGEICVFCHTPHGADTAAAVPLWNKHLGASSSYTTYNSLGTSSLDGATAPVGSVSLACLSCHDGTQAMNVMINQPGSGGYNANGAAQSGTWSGLSSRIDTATGKLATGSIANLTTDLKNDHPIGIQYGGGMPGNVAYTTSSIASGTLNDKDFQGLQYANVNGNNVWWVDTASGTAGKREKTDMMLYTRKDAQSLTIAGAVSGTLSGDQAFVECASCHDPHSENTTFLRIPNTGSAVCLACHIK